MTKKKPALTRPLTLKQQRFALEYCVDYNGSQAARRAGYSKITSNRVAHELLKDPRVQAMIKAETAPVLQRLETTKEDVLAGLTAIGFADRSRMFDADGNMLHPVHWPPELRFCLEGIKVVKRNMEAGDGHTDTVWEVKLAPKTNALELLGRSQALFTDRVEVEVTQRQELVKRLHAGRDRWAKVLDAKEVSKS